MKTVFSSHEEARIEQTVEQIRSLYWTIDSLQKAKKLEKSYADDIKIELNQIISTLEPDKPKCETCGGSGKPEIICLCGSTRFTDEMLIKQWELTKEGKIVLSWCALPESYFKGSHIGDAEGVKDLVDEVHKRKIDLADKVLVININNYIGESTRSEINYAIKTNKPVEYLCPDCKGEKE